MRFLWSSCAILVLLQGGALCDDSKEGGETSEDNTACSGDGNFLESAARCLTSHEGFRDTSQFKVLEKSRQFFSNYCQDEAKTRKCLFDMKALSQRCLNETVQQGNHIFLGLLNTSVTIGCANNGYVYSQLFYGLQEPPEVNQILHACLQTMDDNLSRAQHNGLSHSTLLLLLYRGILEVKECVIGRIELDEQTKNVSDTFVRDLRRGMECIHPRNNTLVLCSDIEHSNSSTV